jgi:L-threonylcarbamoyladenylate synthase
MAENGKSDYFCGMNREITNIGADIEKAVNILRAGGLVAIPTETVYGLGANALNEIAVLSIFQVKNRPTFDPLIVHIAQGSDLGLYAEEPSEMAWRLAEHYWPGPLTLVLKRKSIIPDLVSSGLDTVAIRVPNHPQTLDLLSQINFPLAAPSANPFGYVSPTCSSHVHQQLGAKIDYILEGGESKVGLESTVLDLSGSAPVILRRGGLPEEELESFLGIKIQKTLSSSRPGSPGMLHSHYAPRCTLLTYSGDDWQDRTSNLSPIQFSEAYWIRFSHELPAVDKQRQLILSKTADLNEAARNLFRSIRELDNRGASIIYAEKVPDIGLGRAINDRLTRASSRLVG